MTAFIFMKVAGVTGESENAQFSGWIELDSAHMGVDNPRGPGTSPSSKSSATDISVIGVVDKATPTLFQKCANGDRIPKVEIAFIKGDQEQVEYMRWTMENCYCSSVKTGGGGGGSGSGRQVAVQYGFNFAKIKVDYKQQTDKGFLGGGTSGIWDIAINKP